MEIDLRGIGRGKEHGIDRLLDTVEEADTIRRQDSQGSIFLSR